MSVMWSLQFKGKTLAEYRVPEKNGQLSLERVVNLSKTSVKRIDTEGRIVHLKVQPYYISMDYFSRIWVVFDNDNFCLDPRALPGYEGCCKILWESEKYTFDRIVEQIFRE